MRRKFSIVLWFLVVAMIGSTGCRDRESGQVVALEDPQSLASISGCFDSTNEERFFSVDSEECDPEERTYGAVVADPTQRWLQLAALDTRSFRLLAANQRAEGCLGLELSGRQCVDRALQGARFIDYDARTPGNTGIPLPTQPTRVVESNVDGVVWVVGQNPRVLMAVDMIHERVATFASGEEILALDFPVSDVIRLRDENELVFADPSGRVLRRADAEIVCDDGDNSASCELTADFELDDEVVPLEKAPRFITSDGNHDVYVSSESNRWVTRISLGDGDCPADDPCRIPLTWECNDGLDNDGDGLVDTEDESCFEREGSESPPADSGNLPECNDGIDNDGDGNIDALDEGCGGASDRDEGDSSVWNPDTCGDGWDNDQDGLIDSEDPQCAAGEANEFGYGPIVEPQAGPATFPRYKRTPVVPGPLSMTAEDDILVIGERGGNRSETDQSNEILLACANPPEDPPEAGEEHLCQEANTLITEALDGDRTRENFFGASANGTISSVIAFSRLEEFVVTNDEGEGALPLARLTRFAWATTSSGNIFSVIIDETFFWNEEGSEETTRGYVGLARLEDADRNNAEVRALQRDLPDRFPFFEPDEDDLNEEIDPTADTFFPSLIAIAPFALTTEQGGDEDTRLDGVENAEPEAFVRIEPEARYCFIGDGIEELGCLPRPPQDSGFQPYDFRRELTALPDGDEIPYTEDQRIVPNDFKIPDEDWILEWEGSLLIGRSGSRRSPERRDAVVFDEPTESDNDMNGEPEQYSRVEFLGTEPCERSDSETLCNMEFGWSACDELIRLCEDGVDICANDVSPCDICPSACASEVNLCEAGVQPGDILLVPQVAPGTYCFDNEDGCSTDSIPDQCLGGVEEDGASYYGTPTNERVTFGNQFRIVDVDAHSVLVTPLDFSEDARWPSPETPPSPTCLRRPFQAEIIAADSWSLGGTRIYGHDSPYEEVNEKCRLRADNDVHIGRPKADEVWQDPSGLRFKIDSGEFFEFCEQTSRPAECRHAMRGFRFRFTTEDRFTTRTVSGLGTLSIAAAYSPNRNLLYPLLLFLDMGSGSLFVIENEANPSSNVLR
jgi:hypothetical protein